MAMLAEPKSKQKWSSDPRNTTWTNDTSRFGYQMLTKMGWQSGKGLGAKEDGSTTHVKSVKRRDNLGLGADKSNEDNWLSHQLEFDDLLSRLNDHSENGNEVEKPTKKRKQHEMEKTARQSRKRVFYNRFIQSKDLSSKSAEDMACIFGQRSKSVPGTPREQSEGEESDDSTASCPPPSFHGVQTVTSGQSIQEYFEMKMREMKAAREGKEMRGETTVQEQMVAGKTRNDGVKNTESADEELQAKKKKKEKRRKRKPATEACELKSDETNLHFDENECPVKKKKKYADGKGWESSEGKECKVLKETKREKRKKKKGVKLVSDSETRQIEQLQSEMIESLETEEMVRGAEKKDKKKRKKDKATLVVDLEMSCEIEERNDQKDSLKKATNSNKEKTCKDSLPEAEGTKDKRKKTSRKDKSTLSLEVETVEMEIKKEKKKKKKKVK